METSEAGWSEFEKEWTRAVIASINAIRDAADLTVKELAGRLRTLGWTVSDATISGMLSGDKRSSISIAEVTVFARALNVSPLYFVLGLPFLNKLPAGKLWSPAEPNVELVGEWFTKSTLLAPYPGDQLTPRDNDSSAYAANAIARHGLQDVLDFAHYMRVIRWQASQLVAFDRFDSNEIQESMPKAVWDQEYLWEALNRLSHARKEQRKLGDGWGIPLNDLPEVLRFIDEDPIVQRDDFTIAELTELALPEQVQAAAGNTKEVLERVRSSRSPADVVDDGSPS